MPEFDISLNDLGLATWCRSGKLLPALRAEVKRELTPEDLVRQEASSLGSAPGRLKRVRAVHHSAARLLATGMKIRDVSAAVGMAPITITNLQNDPAFRELIEHYAQSENARFAKVRERLRDLGLVATEELMERLLESPEEMSERDLLEILKATMDRSGNGPTSTQQSVSFRLGADDIASIKEAADGEKVVPRSSRTAGRVIEHESVGPDSSSEGEPG